MRTSDLIMLLAIFITSFVAGWLLILDLRRCCVLVQTMDQSIDETVAEPQSNQAASI